MSLNYNKKYAQEVGVRTNFCTTQKLYFQDSYKIELEVTKMNDKYHAKFGSYLILKKHQTGFTSSSGKDFYLRHMACNCPYSSCFALEKGTFITSIVCTFKQERNMKQPMDVVISGCGRNHRPITDLQKGTRNVYVHVPAHFDTKLHIVPCRGGFLR